jgi:F-type H+-transporting ATPase subunit epsilon
MQHSAMNLRILLPFQVFAETAGVTQIIAETQAGSFGLLPNRLDCVAALTAGILVIETEGDQETYLAIDEGLLVKTGGDILVSVRNAISGTGLGDLREAVEREFLTLNEHEQSVRAVLARMESGFIRRFLDFHHE